jgi:hypothetical protein
MAVVVAGATLSACTQTAGPSRIDRVTFTPANLSPAGYRDEALESLPAGDPTKPGSGNLDAVTAIVAPGVIRLGVSGRCSGIDDDAPPLCVVRNELRELQDSRGAFRHPAFFGIKLRLAGAVPGARNDPARRDGKQRLMLAQIKFTQPPGRGKPRDYSPLLALRYEDDLLFATTDMTGREIPLRVIGNRCAGGVLARRRDGHESGDPYRVLLASEEGRLPFDFDPAYHDSMLCLETDTRKLGAMSYRGSPSFPRQPRDRFFQLVMQIDGGRRDEAYVRLFLNGAPIVSMFGRIASGVDADRSYFKFGPYGTLPAGRSLSIDYADFRRAPGCAELGLSDWTGSVRNDCMRWAR